MKILILGTKTPQDSQDTQINTLLYNYGLAGDFDSYWISGSNYEQSISENSNSLREYIKLSDPQIILGLGSAIAKFLIGGRYVSLSKQSGKILSTKIDEKEYPILLTYSIAYTSNDEDLRTKLVEDILKVVKYISGEFSDFSSKDLKVALTYDEFEFYINQYLVQELISYDIETNAQPVHSKWFKTIGFSLSGNKNSGIYVVREALEHKISEEEWKLITEKLVEILKTHRIIVHNSMYEVPAAANEYDYRLENWEDTLAMARLLLGGQTGAGLKEQCQENLGYSEWEEDLTIYREAMDSLRNLFKPTDSGVAREEFTKLKDYNGDLLSLYEELKELGAQYYKQLDKKVQDPESEYSKEDCLNDKYAYLKQRGPKIVKAIDDIFILIKDYYNEDSEHTPSSIMWMVGKELINLVDSGEYGFLPYSSIPLKILSKYGAIDAVGTYELYEKLSDRITKESTKDVDLWKGYGVIKAQLEVATSMEMAGLHWDDKVAQGEQDWFNEHACEAMRNMLLSGFLDENIFQNCRVWWIDYLIENDKEELVSQLGFDYVLTDLGIKKFENGEVKGREIRKYNIPNYIPKEYWESVKVQLIRYAKIQILDESRFKYFDEFKDIYNPASPKQHLVLNPILVTDDVKLAMVLQSIYLILDDANRDVMEEFESSDRELFRMLQDFRTKNKEISEWNENNPDDKKPEITNHEIFESFKSMVSTTRFKSSELNNLIIEGLKYQLSSGDEPSMIEIYHLYQLLGFDIEDESTWNESFRFLYNFRMYKKCIKMITSYVTGSKLGRGMVTVVNNDELMNPMPIRRDWYSEDHPKSEDQSYIMESSFGPCTANTLRWKSGFHTIPSTSSIKNIYTSRYMGGTIFAPDYSQNEVRAIAAVSKCESLIQAFRDGIDIHKFNASKIWKKPLEEVTSVERRYAKMSTFSLLYGDTPEGFANKFLAGDVSLGRQIFHDFYEAYPEIHKWTMNRHQEWRDTGKVSLTLTGMFLKISDEEFFGDESKADRASGNYPIQSQSSNIAGYVLASVDRFLRQNNMLTRPVLFIHDSLEFDVFPKELLFLSKKVIDMMLDIPNKDFEFLAKVDLELGVSLGQGLEATDVQMNENHTEGSMIIEGKLSNFEPLINQWRLVYREVDYEYLEDPQKIYVPRGDLFVPKLTLSKNFGTYEQLIKAKVHIKY